MNLTQKRRQNLATVKKILIEFELGGLKQVQKYLNQKNIIIEPNSWVAKIKNLLENKDHKYSVTEEIKLIQNKFKWK